MSDPIIPGIDDARAREIALFMRDNTLFPAKEWPDMPERSALVTGGYATLIGRITVKGRALWERINTDDQ